MIKSVMFNDMFLLFLLFQDDIVTIYIKCDLYSVLCTICNLGVTYNTLM